MEKNQTGKYLKYALSEIVLVVIGILIALSINNWNTINKDFKRAESFLVGMKEDLAKDTLQLNEEILTISQRLAYYKLYDPSFEYLLNTKFSEKDSTLQFKYLFYRTKSYRASTGTYNSLIADGQSHLISNRKLFNQMQNVFETEINRALSVYDVMKTREDNVQWKWAYKIKYDSYDTFQEISDKALLADLSYFHNQLEQYGTSLENHKQSIIDLIRAIEIELKND
jgi:Family of unknown function (DUF6090)